MRALGVQTPLPGTRGGMNMGIYADGTAAGRKLYYGGIKIRKMALGNRKVYSSGNICTYHVEEGTTYMEEVDEGASCLSPQSFTPEKEGWEFAGWRQDAAAEGEVLGSLVMGDDPVELYAVFRQEVVLETVANGTTEREIKASLYNNGNMANPMFTVASPSKAGATFKGWSSGAGSMTIINAAIINLELNTSTTRWAVFQYADKTISNVEGNYWTITDNWGTQWFLNKTGPEVPYPATVDLFMGAGVSIDCSRYSRMTINNIFAGFKAHFKDDNGGIRLTCGGTVRTLVTGDNSGGSRTGSFSIDFAQTSGNTSCQMSAYASRGTMSATVHSGYPPYVYTIVLSGRTVVG